MKNALMILLLAVSLSAVEIPEKKQTTLGLYVNAREAYEMWQADMENVNVLDVRTEGEYIFVGHAPMAVNIPLKFLVGANSKGQPMMKLNEQFVQEVKAKFAETDILLIMCRSGGRGAAAVNMLAEAGFSKAYNIYDGFEGDVLDKEGSYNNGKRVLNGWKNSGAPWTYEIVPNLAYTVIDAN